MGRAATDRKAREEAAKKRMQANTASRGAKNNKRGRGKRGRGGSEFSHGGDFVEDISNPPPRSHTKQQSSPKPPPKRSEAPSQTSVWDQRKQEADQKRLERQRREEEEKARQQQKEREERILRNAFKLNAKPCVWSGNSDVVHQNCMDNPLCIRGFGEYTKGLWEVDPKQKKQIDPTEDLRTGPFVGLKNLGATCYMNSMLQCLYMNRNFRQALYQCPTTFDNKDEENFLSELQKLFASMQLSKKKACSPEAITHLLGIETSVQEDVQEFNNLLMNHLEELFLKTDDSLGIRHTIREEFGGKMCYKTKCGTCGEIEATPSTFLELPLTHGDSLMDCLRFMLTPEDLSGDNQYHCNRCNALVDAKRKMFLNELPPVLVIQLGRFVYDPKTWTKTKQMRNIVFPAAIDMKPYVIPMDKSGKKIADERESDHYQYQLCGVLLHMGDSANYGHYMAHIRDEATGEWWRFNDTEVKKLSDCTNVGDFDEETRAHYELSAAKPFQAPRGTYHSQNAYMLIYSRGNRTAMDPQPPTQALEEVGKVNAVLQSRADAFMEKKNQRDSIIKAHTTELEHFFQVASLPPPHEPASPTAEEGAESTNETEKSEEAESYWINPHWLQEWALGTNKDLPIDNTALLCPHDKLNPSVPFKRISAEAWHFLHDKYGGGPALRKSDACLQCALDIANAQSMNAEEVKLREKMIAESRKTAETEEGFWVSSAWLQDWASAESPSELSSAINKDITCPHEELSLDRKARRTVTAELWTYLHQRFPEATLYPYTQKPCPECQKDLEAEREQEQKEIEKRNQERAELTTLWIPPRMNSMKYGTPYYLIPLDWFEEWKVYVKSPKKEKPGPIDNHALLCDHERLKYDPNASRTFLARYEHPFQLVNEKDWKTLSTRYQASPPIQIQREKHPEGKDDVFLCTPDVCEECSHCLFESLLAEKAASLKRGKIWVEVPMTGGRGGSRVKRSSVVADACDSVSLLKLKVMEAVGIEPNQQLLTYRGQVLEDDHTLRQCYIVADSVLQLERVAQPIKPAHSSPSNPTKVELQFSPSPPSNGGRKKKQSAAEKEGGFQGSRLTSDRSQAREKEEATEPWTCTVCTLSNSPFVTMCSVCGAPAPLKDGRWVCTTCTFINEAGDTICITCETDKP